MHSSPDTDPTPPWHALPPGAVLRRLGTGPDGLSRAEAAARLARYGPNVFERSPPVSPWSVLLAQLRSVVVALLVVAGAVALLSGDLLDATAILAVLVLNVAIGFVTELRAHRAMESLLRLEVTRAAVIREGGTVEVDARELVPGDVVVLEAGATVPADVRLLEAAELRIVEASLTGEPEPVDKQADATVGEDASLPDRVTMAYKATTAVAGRATAAVVATGMTTEVGRIGTLTAGVVEGRTPLEARLDTLGRRLAAVAVGVGGLVALLGWLQGQALGELLQTAVALAVAAVPEGLPVVGTIAMAVGMRRMARRRALIRHLPVVETLGSATVVCTDKTGTLTAGRMTATVLCLAEGEVPIPGGTFTPSPEAALALRIGALANRAAISWTEEAWQERGDPTETALLVAAAKAGLDPDRLRWEWPDIGEVPFSSQRMYMATFHTTPGGIVACVKGAPGRVLELCDRVQTANGVRELRREERERLLELNHALARRGLRVLALASRVVEEAGAAGLRGLVWAGYVGLADPPAPGVRETISAFRAAGMRTVMLTGDQQLTASTVATELGLLGPGDGVLDGRAVDKLSDAELRAAAGRTAVYSRVSPEAKLRIVGALQAGGEIVAMLGDGVNDAAALRKADIGVAMGGRGTDLAKEAADVTLEDDRFVTIAAAVEQGRVIFDNIRKFVFYLFSCNLAEIAVVLGAGIAGYPSPLLPLQILWLNLLTDTFPALALAVEPGEPDIMRQPPRDPREAILSRGMMVTATGYAVLIAGAALGAFAWGLRGPAGSPARASTLAFLALALAQIFHLGNARSAGAVLSWRRMVGNRFALGAVALAVVLQILAVTVPPLARVLRVQPPDARDWLVVL
ncbi:MAG TPA: cation-translocating P-type ATPase, partial [Gemmatimonadales bacterium]|nr:cation-translocating P-type ATPase [Gemmatimonadales bacterium]